ncbi:DNA-binding protein [Bradyrhizobium sp. 1050_B9_N1_2]|uniref:DNA-binding protein n=1 Tax=Bradyrhizobium sp. 1050_B9_N1_2 TaxID=3238688 RepID=UPI003EDC3B31
MSDLNASPSLATAEPCLADDMLRGAEAIAEFLFGDAKQRRKVYHVVETGKLPTFRLGAILCARKSKLLAWIEQQERQSVGAKS